MNYIDMVFNHWIWDDPYVKANQAQAFKNLDKMFGDDVMFLTHVAGDGIGNSDFSGYYDHDFITVYHTFDLTAEQKQAVADAAALIASKKKSRQKEYGVDISVCFVRLDSSSYYYYPFPAEK